MVPRICNCLCLLLLAGSAACEVVSDPLLLDPPPVNPVPALPAFICNTAYFDQTLEAGFNPPPGVTGPLGSARFAPGAQWFEPGAADPSMTFLALPAASDVTLADAAFDAAEAERNATLGNRVVLRGAIVLDSGQDGWLIRSVNEAFVFAGVPPTTTVIVLAVENGRLFELRGDGPSEDFDTLLASVLSLCIES